MRSSGIGGEAVMEGVMMKNGNDYAVAVRADDGSIRVESAQYKGIVGAKIYRIPFLRGIFVFIDSLVLGIKALTQSAEIGMDEGPGEEQGEKDGSAAKKKESEDNAMIAMTVVVAIVIAVALFMVLPVMAANFLGRWVKSEFGIVLIEGLLRLAIFLIYIVAISRMKDIQRVFMYHGAEHKCINCVEHGRDLNVDNVRESSRFHPRCGTSFMLLVMLIALILFLFVRVRTMWLRVLTRIIFLPVIAAVAYEVLRLGGRSDSPVMRAVSRPGLWMQRLTTREPDDDMIEVGIASVEAVFDWKPFVEEVRGGMGREEADTATVPVSRGETGTAAGRGAGEQ